MTMQEIYAAAVIAGTLRPDPVQEAALLQLERIRAGLAAPAPRKGFFRKAPPPMQGLYLWGGVGRGKSMLMDMLYDAVDAPKQRRHFHAFMQWVHALPARTVWMMRLPLLRRNWLVTFGFWRLMKCRSPTSRTR
jgi:cell division protein ZapE